MSTHELEQKARELRQLQAIIEEAQAEAEGIKEQIKAAMGDHEAMQAGEYKITYRTVKTARIDTGALRRAFPGLVERFTRETVTRRFIIA